MTASDSSVQLLARAHDGDAEAVDALIARHRDWLWSYVRRHMNDGLRHFEASEDVVQDVLRKLIQRGPRFIPRNDDEFRRLVATIVINRLRDRHDWVNAGVRQGGEERIEADDAPTHIGLRADSAFFKRSR